MLAKLALLVHNKVALAAIGVALLGGGRAAAAVAVTHGTLTLPGQSAAQHSSTPTPKAGDNSADHDKTSLEGVLQAYNAGAGTITVLGVNDSAATTFEVNASTDVVGFEASHLSDLAKSIGQKVQVQATRQSNGSLLATKVTVQGPGTGNGGGSDQSTLTGTVVSVNTSAGSFVVRRPDGTKITVTVSAQTEFKGSLSKLSDLKAGEHVTLQGSMQSSGAFAASSVEG